uniref:hypothetical protein n=1 Tax=Brachyspira hyodysenteriae TaxID=159 RepID=UPI0011773C04
MKYTKVERDLIKTSRLGKDSLLNFVMKEFFNAVTEDDILREVRPKVFIMQGREVPPEFLQSFAAEAKAIMQMGVLRELLKAMRYEANKLMYEKSTSLDDMRFGKAVLFSTVVLEKKIENLAKFYDEKEPQK